MTTEVSVKNVLKMDVDGNWYSIPPYLNDTFTLMVESVENAEFMSNERTSLQSEFEESFGEYKK